MYDRSDFLSQAVLPSPSQAAEQQERARALAKEIRATDPSNELVLSVASDLDELVGALGFAMEYASLSGVRVSVNVLGPLFDALNQLAEDAAALGETLGTPSPLLDF